MIWLQSRQGKRPSNWRVSLGVGRTPQFRHSPVTHMQPRSRLSPAPGLRWSGYQCLSPLCTCWEEAQALWWLPLCAWPGEAPGSRASLRLRPSLQNKLSPRVRLSFSLSPERTAGVPEASLQTKHPWTSHGSGEGGPQALLVGSECGQLRSSWGAVPRVGRGHRAKAGLRGPIRLLPSRDKAWCPWSTRPRCCLEGNRLLRSGLS